MVSESIEKIIEWRKKETLLNILLKRYLRGKLVSKVEYFDTPLGEKVIIYCARPRLVLGRANERISEIISLLKEQLGFKNPQVEAIPVENPLLDANIVAEMIAIRIEKYGSRVIRKIIIKTAEQVMQAGAKGIEIKVSGKVIGERASSIRYSLGYMKKSGEINKKGVRKAVEVARLPQGIVGIQVRILPDVRLPDEINIKNTYDINIEELEKIDSEIAKKFREIIESS